jgi:hypothetical protein
LAKKKEKTVYTEFLHLLRDAEGWLLSIKRFYPYKTKWKDMFQSSTFRLIRAEKKQAIV